MNRAALLLAPLATLNSSDHIFNHQPRMSLVYRLTLLATLSAASSRAEEARNFEDHILPLLREHCASCHRPGKTRGGLDVTTLEKLEKGSSAGPPVVAGLAE